MGGWKDSVSAQKPVQFGFERTPAAADFNGPDAAFRNIFEVGGTRNLQIFTGLFGGINVFVAVFIKSVGKTPVAPVKTAAPVVFFAPIFTASALHDVIVNHNYHLKSSEYQKNSFGFQLIASIGMSSVFL
jgi:hypothetical protein